MSWSCAIANTSVWQAEGLALQLGLDTLLFSAVAISYVCQRESPQKTPFLFEK
jgi:hypothetical protein